MDTSTVTRFEVIDEAGRSLVRYDVHVTVVLQDEARTMKVFLTPREDSDVEEDIKAGLKAQFSR